MSGELSKVSSSQSLFQIYYLGHTPVDRRCSSTVMPWVIEELKLRAEEMKLIWLSPGREGVAYVADNGEEMFTHTYGCIVRCCIAIDGISFAYIAHREKDDKYFCHVFQALTYEEASMIMQQFKANAQGERVDNVDKTSEERFTELAKHQLPLDQARLYQTGCEYSLQYIGNTEVLSPTGSQVDFIDATLAKMREVYAKKNKRKRKLGKKGTSRSSVSSVESVDFATPLSTRHSSTASSEPSEGSENLPVLSPTSSADRSQSSSAHSLADRRASTAAEEEEVAIRVTRATPERDEIGDEKMAEIPEENGLGENVSLGDLEGVCGRGVAAEQNGGWDSDENRMGCNQEPSIEVALDNATEATGIGSLVDQQQLQNSTINHSCTKQGESVTTPVTEDKTPKSLRLGDSIGLSQLPPPGVYHYHVKQQSYEVEEVMFQMADKNEQEEDDEDMEMRVGMEPLPRKRSLTVLSVGGTILTEKESVNAKPVSPRRRHSLPGIKDSNVSLGRGAMEFDTLPELESLRRSPEFQALRRPLELPVKAVKLVFSGLSVSVVSRQSREPLLRRTIRTIACCGQGYKEPDCIGFISREGAAKKYFCHLFRAPSERMATAVVDTFKSTFVHALSVALPAALCDSCPLQQLHDLCQGIEGVSTQVAQLRIQDCLSSLNESDYAIVMKQYKASEHVDHEYTQLVVLLALLRQHFQKKQEQHTHPQVSFKESEVRPRGNSVSKPSRLSALERAKMALATSFDNLRRPKRGNTIDNPSEKSANSISARVGSNKASQSVNIPPVSPLFSKKIDFDTLAAPLSPARGKVQETKRPRSGSFRFRRPNSTHSSSDDVSQKSHSEDERQSKSKTKSKSQKLSSKHASGDEAQQELTASPPSSPCITPHNSPPHTPPAEQKSDMLFTSQHVFKTPTRSPVMKKRNMRPRARKATITSNQRAAFTPPNNTLPFKRGHRRSMSWRQDMFELCATPSKDGLDRRASIQELELGRPPIDQLGGRRARSEDDLSARGRRSPRTRARERWKSAIEQQILVHRLEKENQSLLKASTDRLKLAYKDPTLNVKEAGKVWSEILTQAQPRKEDVHKALILGVPPNRRGEVWQFLIGQYQSRQGKNTSFSTESYQTLINGETPYEHNITMDIGRTFPTHPYFSGCLRHPGQKSLYNILLAYAVADTDTGYCQGLSFVAGMILMHMKDEESAFKILCHFLQTYNYREIYSKDLSTLQVRLYQLSRLLHDLIPDLSLHLRRHEVAPFFYAAPWFLTLFASQFPIAFVARIMDVFFYEGPEFIFKVTLSLLDHYQDFVVQHGSMESTSNYLKNHVPMDIMDNMQTIITEALQLDLGNKLQTFETEFQLIAELTESFQVGLETPDLDSMNGLLKKQSRELIEQLAICRGSIQNMESTIQSLKEQVSLQQQRIERLETEQQSISDGNS